MDPEMLLRLAAVVVGALIAARAISRLIVAPPAHWNGTAERERYGRLGHGAADVRA